MRIRGYWGVMMHGLFALAGSSRVGMGGRYRLQTRLPQKGREARLYCHAGRGLQFSKAQNWFNASHESYSGDERVGRR